jgi:transforming growth factor-beta-induced protein
MKRIFTLLLSSALLSNSLFSAKKDIVETADSAGTFKTLIAAAQAAGLVETLKSEGPFTVFAPTDEAFAKIPKTTLEDLLKPENKATLANILKYHVVSGKVRAKKAAKLESAETVSGEQITITKSDQGLKINESNVVKADIKTSNGIIHVIDAVLLPEAIQKSLSAVHNADHIITQAIHKGVPLFNQGHHDLTAKMYMDAGMKVLHNNSPQSCDMTRKTIHSALQKASSHRCSTTQAWIMRRAFDHVLAN